MFVPTRSSQLKFLSGDSCQTVVYERKKNEENQSSSDEEETQKRVANKTNVEARKRKKGKDDSKWNMKKLRYDIIKFGTTGFKGEKKEESKIALAVSLGALPPKKKYVNYKDLLKEKKAEKIVKAKEKKANRNKSFKKNKTNFNSNRSKQGNNTKRTGGDRRNNRNKSQNFKRKKN